MLNRRGFIIAGLASALTFAIGKRGEAQDLRSLPSPVATPYGVVDQSVLRHPTLASSGDQPVGVQLCLAFDNSASMSEDEYQKLALDAMALAINSEQFRQAVKYKAGDQSVAICVLDFDNTSWMRVPWVDIRGDEINEKPYDRSVAGAQPDKLDFLAMEIRQLVRRSPGGTEVSAAVNKAKTLFEGCPWRATERKVLDVFGDGSSGAYALRTARDRLSETGVTINGFAIVNEDQVLDRFFRDNLVSLGYRRGPDGIVSEPGRVWAVARNAPAQGNTHAGLKSFFEEVATGMKQKITVEMAGLTDYYNTLARLGQAAPQPVPPPVAPATPFSPSLFG